MKLPTLGEQEEEAAFKNEIAQTGWKRASFRGNKREVSMRLWLLSHYIEWVEGRH